MEVMCVLAQGHLDADDVWAFIQCLVIVTTPVSRELKHRNKTVNPSIRGGLEQEIENARLWKHWRLKREMKVWAEGHLIWGCFSVFLGGLCGFFSPSVWSSELWFGQESNLVRGVCISALAWNELQHIRGNTRHIEVKRSFLQQWKSIKVPFFQNVSVQFRKVQQIVLVWVFLWFQTCVTLSRFSAV